jgi:hypothetical protein
MILLAHVEGFFFGYSTVDHCLCIMCRLELFLYVFFQRVTIPEMHISLIALA